jgi:aminoglycoside phosphotransferase (APT) family kinase protein
VALRDALEEILGAAIVRLERRPYAYETSHPLEELDVELEDGQTLRLLRKDLGTSPVKRPSFLHAPAREIETYRRVLESADLGTAKFYGAADEQLYIEKVEGSELWQHGELEAWQRAARWLARMHAALGDQADQPHLLRYDREFYRLWLVRAEAISGDLGLVASVYDDVVERLLALPQGLIHGDFYPSNILVAQERICPVDWELGAAGPLLLDLAALTTGWPEADHDTIVAAYGEVSSEALDLCRLQLAVRWLGWSDDWTPPSEHAKDWRREAQAVAERLAV